MLAKARRPNVRAARVPRQVLPQGAKTRVRIFADIQNFALRAHCVRCIPFVSLNNASEEGLSNFRLTGQTAKAAKNEHTLQERMCWNAKLPGVDHHGCQTLQQCRGRWVAQCTAQEMSRNNLAGSLCV